MQVKNSERTQKKRQNPRNYPIRSFPWMSS